MTVDQAISKARRMVIQGVRGLGTMSLHTASGKSYGILTGEVLVDEQGNEVAAESITEEIESVTTRVDELGGLYI